MFAGAHPMLKTNILLVGNPGGGKSTLLNTIIKKKHFKSGISMGAGMTFDFDVLTLDGVSFMDTPGLADIEMRQQAANAITTALRQAGFYKVIFISVLTQGRLRPEDTTLLQLILQSAPEMTSYGFVFNQVPPHAKSKLAEEKDVLNLLLRGGIPKDRLPTDTFVIGRIPEIDEVSDVFIEDATDFLAFVKNAQGVEIKPQNVSAISMEGFDELRGTLEKKMNLIAQQNVSFDNQIKKLLEDRAEERKQYRAEREEERKQHQKELEALRKQIATLQMSPGNTNEKNSRESTELFKQLDKFEISDLYSLFLDGGASDSMIWTLSEEQLRSVGLKFIQRSRYDTAKQSAKKEYERYAKTVLIHSQGTAFEHQKNSLGLFQNEGFSNGKPYYKKKSEETYLHWSSDSFWKVSTKKEHLGTSKSVMYSSNAKEVTQEEFSSSKWKVLDGKSVEDPNWIEDTTLTCHLNYGHQLMITSDGIAKEFQSECLGNYVLDGGFSNGKPTYKHVSNNRFIHWDPTSNWMLPWEQLKDGFTIKRIIQVTHPRILLREHGRFQTTQ